MTENDDLAGFTCPKLGTITEPLSDKDMRRLLDESTAAAIHVGKLRASPAKRSRPVFLKLVSFQTTNEIAARFFRNTGRIAASAADEYEAAYAATEGSSHRRKR